MPDYTNSLSITFLGTAAGRPCPSRNVSSLAIKLDKAIWVVDAGEATQHQFMKSRLKMGNVTKLFVTHMHADHIFGLPGLLCTISAGEGSVLPGEVDPRLQSSSTAKPTEIYGPLGLRSFLRHTLLLSHSILSRPYIVHELLFSTETASPTGTLHPSERHGLDLVQDSDGFWRDFATDAGFTISAGSILHTVPCIGYTFTELPRPLPLNPSLYLPHLLRPENAAALLASGIRDPRSLLSTLSRTLTPITLADGAVLSPPLLGGPGRKLVVLGDTYDASPMEALAHDADWVVHECTNAYLPEEDEAQRKVTQEMVEGVAKGHGHSTTRGAGEFARRVGARGLVVNHLSVKYPDVAEEKEGVEGENGVKGNEGRERKRKRIEAIGRKVSESWGGGVALVARDFMCIDVPRKAGS